MSIYCGVNCPHLNKRKNYCEKWGRKLLSVKWSFKPIHKELSVSEKVIVVKVKGVTDHHFKWWFLRQPL